MKKIIIVLLLFWNLPLFSQDAILIKNNMIDEQKFLRNYLDYSLEKQAIKSRVLASEQQVAIALQPYTGSIFADASYISGTTTNLLPLHNILTNGVPLTKDYFRINYTNVNASAGVDAVLYITGTYLKIQGGVKDYNIGSQILDVTLPQNTAPNPSNPQISPQNYRDKYLYPYFNITLVQPWLKNGFAYNFHRRVIQIASNETSIEKVQAKQEIANIVLQGLIQYHKLILQTKIIGIAEESLADLKAIYTAQSRLQRVGARARFDIQQLELKINEITAILDQEKNTLELSFQILEEKIHLSLNRNDLNLVDHSLVMTNEYTPEQIYDTIKENSNDLEKINLLLQKIQYSVSIIKNQRLPELNTILSYDISESQYRNHPSLNARGQDFNVPQDNLYIGLQFKMPLVPISENAKLRQINAQSNQLIFTQKQAEEQLNHASREKYLDWFNARFRINQQQQNLKLNQVIVTEALRRYRNSEMSILDYFNYEENFRQNQRKLAEDEFYFKINAISIEFLQGTLLSSYGIDFE